MAESKIVKSELLQRRCVEIMQVHSGSDDAPADTIGFTLDPTLF